MESLHNLRRRERCVIKVKINDILESLECVLEIGQAQDANQDGDYYTT